MGQGIFNDAIPDPFLYESDRDAEIDPALDRVLPKRTDVRNNS